MGIPPKIYMNSLCKAVAFIGKVVFATGEFLASLKYTHAGNGYADESA